MSINRMLNRTLSQELISWRQASALLKRVHHSVAELKLQVTKQSITRGWRCWRDAHSYACETAALHAQVLEHAKRGDKLRVFSMLTTRVDHHVQFSYACKFSLILDLRRAWHVLLAEWVAAMNRRWMRGRSRLQGIAARVSPKSNTTTPPKRKLFLGESIISGSAVGL